MQDSKEDSCDLDEKSWLLTDWNDPNWRPPKKGLLESCTSHILDPNHRPFRYIIAIILGCVQGILTYTVELPAGLETTIIRVMKIDNAHYSVIFSAYSWADIIMSLIGSVIANKYLGVRKGFVIFISIVTLGQLLCAVGCYLGSFWIYLCGRLVIGCGNGTTTCILNTFQVLWFAGKEIAFIMSLARIFSRSCATLALVTPQIAYDGLSTVISSPLSKLGTTQMVGTLICIIGILCTVAVVGLDKYGAKMIGRKPHSHMRNTSRNTTKSASVKIFDVLNFTHAFWIIVVSVAVFYGGIMMFTANSPLYFVSKYGFSLHTANLANSLSYTAVIFVTPFISLMIDYIGYHLAWAYAGLVIALSPCLLYLFGGNGYAIPFIAAVLISISYSVFGSTGWAMVGLAVKPHQVTTAYGVAMSISAMTISLYGAMSGMIIDNLGYSLMISINAMTLFFTSNLVLSLFIKESISDNKVFNANRKTVLRQTKNNPSTIHKSI